MSDQTSSTLRATREQAQSATTTTPLIAASPKAIALPETGAARLGAAEARILAHQGYVPFAPMFDPAFIDRLPAEIEALAAEGWLTAPPERIVDGVPTEVLLTVGAVVGLGPDAAIFQRSPMIAALYQALEQFGRDFNETRAAIIAAGLVTPREAPELAIEGMEMNFNRVQYPWTGLHPHRDHHRFTDGSMLWPEESARHAAMRARILTISGYARPLDAAGERRNDVGGALTIYPRPAARQPGDRAIHDVVAADHNTGAAFFAHTMHGVSRMTEPGSLRYSFQAFFPEKRAWRQIAGRTPGAGQPASSSVR